MAPITALDLTSNNAHTIKFTLFKYAIQMFFYIHRVVQLSAQPNSETKQNPVPASGHTTLFHGPCKHQLPVPGCSYAGHFLPTSSCSRSRGPSTLPLGQHCVPVYAE